MEIYDLASKTLKIERVAQFFVTLKILKEDRHHQFDMFQCLKCLLLFIIVDFYIVIVIALIT